MEDRFKPLYKLHRYLHEDELKAHRDVLYIEGGVPHLDSDRFTLVTSQLGDKHRIQLAMREYLNNKSDGEAVLDPPITVYGIKELPGLGVIPSFLPTAIQRGLVRDIVNDYIPAKEHLSNLDLHYTVPRPLHLFDDSQPPIPHKEPQKKPLDIQTLRNKKLRWITLGGQYNWTEKVYPSFTPNSHGFPPFPAPLARLLNGAFPSITPEAAIVNFYSPGDILSPHQDIAELSSADLISASIGCACVFYIGPSRSSSPLSILLNSGDLLIMGGQSRTAYHGVGKVFPNSSPAYLTSDPDDPVWSNCFGPWLSDKRINLNVRQMLDH